MNSELTPNQQLLLWHLGLRGGKALQMEVEYKEIAKDRKDLERRGLLTVGKERRSLARRTTLRLQDCSQLRWNRSGQLQSEWGHPSSSAMKCHGRGRHLWGMER